MTRFVVTFDGKPAPCTVTLELQPLYLGEDGEWYELDFRAELVCPQSPVITARLAKSEKA